MSTTARRMFDTYVNSYAPIVVITATALVWLFLSLEFSAKDSRCIIRHSSYENITMNDVLYANVFVQIDPVGYNNRSLGVLVYTGTDKREWIARKTKYAREKVFPCKIRRFWRTASVHEFDNTFPVDDPYTHYISTAHLVLQAFVIFMFIVHVMLAFQKQPQVVKKRVD